MRHTTSGAFVGGLEIAVPEDGNRVFDGVVQAALDDPHRTYGATIATDAAFADAAADRARAAEWGDAATGRGSFLRAVDLAKGR